MHRSPRLKAGLLKHTLENEVVVYDPGADQIHLLDKTTAAAFDLLSEGKFDDVSAATEISRRVGAPNGAALLELALDELRTSGLIDDSAAPVDVTRRDMLRKAALVGAAAMAVPVVATLTATRGYAQASGSVGLCGACTATTQCAAGRACVSGACGGTGKSANGTTCSGNGNCCSGNCAAGVCAP
jgi:hypothetical protein